MEKTQPAATEAATHLPQSFPPQPVHRKPLPSSTVASEPVITADIKSEAPVYSTFPQSTPIKPYTYDAPLPPLPPPPSLYHRTLTRFKRLSKRTRYLILGGILVLLALIIGLAAGLGSRSSRFSHLPLPSNHGGPYTGDLTYYDPGLGACGITSTSSDYIVAVSHIIFDAVSVGSNPNANPLCGKKVRASRAGKSVDLTVVDRCTGCKPQDLDVSMTVFEGLASVDQGRVGVTWAWLQDVPGGAAAS